MKKTSKQKALSLIGKEEFLSSIFNDYRDDKEVVLAAIKHNGSDIIYASERLRDNKNIVLEALKNNHDKHIIIFRTLSERLRDNPYVTLEAYTQNKNSIYHASKRIQELCKGKEVEITLLGEIKSIEATKLKNNLEKTMVIDKLTTKKLKI